jgi:ribonucleoside-diphosphate reductase alpha chain
MKREELHTAGIAQEPQAISQDVLREKYLKSGELHADQLYARVAKALASVEKEDLREKYEALFLANMKAGAIGAGRIMSAAGTNIKATLINCFVQPVGDCIQGVDDEGFPGIYEALREAAETMRRGGGVGYDFSRIRPRGAEVKGTASMASGPCSYINVFDQSCSTVESAGARRGAQMGVLRIDHPDVHEFITAKRTPGRWNNFNVSVGVPDAFIQAVQNDQEWQLVHRAKPAESLIRSGAHQRASDGLWVYQTIAARELWDTVMRSAYDFAEPGILFLDHINDDNNLRYCEAINATNPCVTADTWVQTEAGPRQVAELIGKPFLAQVNGTLYPVESDGFFSTGEKPVYELQTTNGYRLRLTADHQLRRVAQKTRYTMQLDWSPTQDLKPGDEIVLNDHRAAAGWAGTGSESEGYLIGQLLGDGTLKQDKAVLSVWAPALQVAGSAQSIRSYRDTDGVIDAIETAIQTLPHRSDFKEFQRPILGRGERRLASAALRDLAFELGMSPGKKAVTPEIERQSSDFYIGFLRGLFDADGSVQGQQDKGVSIRLSQSDLSTLEAVQRMLLRLGIISALSSERRAAGRQLLPDGQGNANAYEIRAQHELIISGENLRTFSDVIGFADTQKSNKLITTLGHYKRGLNRERFITAVRSIVPCGTEMVYDVTVRDVHAFDANGFVAHNCGEQPLPSYGCCDLGPIILPRFVRHPFGFQGTAAFDFEAFSQAVALQVRALDNVLDVTWWPLPQQREEAAAKRRIGVGFTGLGNTLTMLGLRYDRDEGRQVATEIAQCMRDAAYAASIELAKEKGAFPAFDANGYLAEGTFASRLPTTLKEEIRKHGIRNSHLLSIAPTGTVSLAFADNASNGIEPAFSWTYRRKKREADGSTREYTVEDHAWRVYHLLGGHADQLPESFVSALDMSAADHIGMMKAVQPFVDTAISKTVNVPADYPYDDFKNLYLQAWEFNLKGLATYRPNSILGAVLETTPTPSENTGDASAMVPADPMRTVIEKRPKGALDAVAEKIEYWTQEGHKTLYIIVSFLPVPNAQGDGMVDRAIEFFMPVGQSGESQQWITSTMRMLSLAARGGFLERSLADMRKVAWDRGPVRLGTHTKSDGAVVPMWHDSEVAAIAFAVQKILATRAQQRPHVIVHHTEAAPADSPPPMASMAGKKCGACGAHAVIRKDGCDFCSQCGELGTCG